METHPIIVFSTKYKFNLLAGILVLAILGGFTWMRLYSPDRTPAPVQTSAFNLDSPHWAHQNKPFSLALVNNTTPDWMQQVNEQVENWDETRTVSLVLMGATVTNCEFKKATINLCSFKGQEDSVVAFTQSVFKADTKHLEGVRIGLNDTVLTQAGPDTLAYRSALLCRHLGLALGAQLRFKEPEGAATCMNSDINNENADIANRPDPIDSSYLSKLYEHNDAPEFVPPTYDLPGFNGYESATSWGELVQSYNNGQLEVYELNLGQGFKMVTVAQMDN